MLGCSAASIKLVLGADGSGDPECFLRDEQNLEELPCTSLVVIKQSLDTSLLELTSKETSEYDEGQTDIYKTSTLLYDGVVIWSTSSHRACHIGGHGGSTHDAQLSGDKMVLYVTSGCVQRQSGDLYEATHKDFAPKRKEVE